jgi:S1-C subfamily serine protease
MLRISLARTVVWMLPAIFSGCASAQNSSVRPSVPVDSMKVVSARSGRDSALRNRGYTGFTIRLTATMGPDHQASSGYPIVYTIQPGSPAEKAGLAAEDVILDVDGKDLIRQPRALILETGVKYSLRIRRGNEEREIILVPVPRSPGH